MLMPSTNWRWKKKNNTKMGTRESTDMANVAPKSVPRAIGEEL